MNHTIKHRTVTQTVYDTIVMIGVFLLLFLVWNAERQTTGDDVYFRNLTAKHPSVLEYLQYRYLNWSSRLLPEIFLYIFSSAPLLWWKCYFSIAIISSTLLLQAHVRLLEAFNYAKQWNVFALGLLSSLGVLYMTPANIRWSMLWVTGAMNYAWIMPLFFAALYAVVRYATQQDWPKKSLFVISGISTILASASNEQAGAFLVGSWCTVVCSTLYNNRKNAWGSIAQKTLLPQLFFLGLSAIGSAYLFIAPGNSKRLVREYEKFMPQASGMSFWERAHESFRWFLQAVVNESGFLWALLLLGLGLLLYQQFSKTKKLSNVLSAGLLILASGIIVLAPSTFSGKVFFYHWLEKAPSHTAYLVYAFWACVIALTCLAPYIAYTKERLHRAWTLSIGIVGYYCTIAIIGISPTMHGSGWRTLFMPSLIMILILLFVFDELLQRYPKILPQVSSLLFLLLGIYSYVALLRL